MPDKQNTPPETNILPNKQKYSANRQQPNRQKYDFAHTKLSNFLFMSFEFWSLTQQVYWILCVCRSDATRQTLIAQVGR